METFVQNAMHILIALGLPPLLLGVIGKTKALFAGRVGPPVLQPYFDLIKLFQKGSVFSTTTTWVFRAGPVVGLVTAVDRGAVGSADELAAPDLLHGRYDSSGLPSRPRPVLHGLGRPGHRLGLRGDGCGAGGDVRLPGGTGVFFGPARPRQAVRVTRNWRACSAVRSRRTGRRPGLRSRMVLLSWFIILLAENSRIPFDDPNTHLELTMIHEVMVLDHSGPAFGMILYGAALKLFVFGALVVRLAFPSATGSSVARLAPLRRGDARRSRWPSASWNR